MAGGTPQGVGTTCAGTSCAALAFPGHVPNGTASRPGVPLKVRKGAAAPELVLSWSVSCSPDAREYTVHEGRIGSWYSHDALLCTTAGALVTATVTPGAAGRTYVIVPVTAEAEGSYGVSSFGVERPVSGMTCLPVQVLGCP
jgi:hypothetical protein